MASTVLWRRTRNQASVPEACLCKVSYVQSGELEHTPGRRGPLGGPQLREKPRPLGVVGERPHGVQREWYRLVGLADQCIATPQLLLELLCGGLHRQVAQQDAPFGLGGEHIQRRVERRRLRRILRTKQCACVVERELRQGAAYLAGVDCTPAHGRALEASSGPCWGRLARHRDDGASGRLEERRAQEVDANVSRLCAQAA